MAYEFKNTELTIKIAGDDVVQLLDHFIDENDVDWSELSEDEVAIIVNALLEDLQFELGETGFTTAMQNVATKAVYRQLRKQKVL